MNLEFITQTIEEYKKHIISDTTKEDDIIKNEIINESIKFFNTLKTDLETDEKYRGDMKDLLYISLSNSFVFLIRQIKISGPAVFTDINEYMEFLTGIISLFYISAAEFKPSEEINEFLKKLINEFSIKEK